VMTVGWSVIGGTASSYGDFSPSSGEVTFGAANSSQTFTINTTASAAGKTIVFGLTIPGGGAATLGSVNTSTLTVLIPPPSVVQFERTAFEEDEGTGVNLSVQRTGTLDNSFTVNWSVTGGNASAESDFSPSSGTLTFGPGDTEKIISLTLATDTVVEGTEAIVLGLSIGSGNAVVGPNASATILIDDVPPAVIQFRFADYRVGESDGVATIEVKRTGNLTIPSTVDYATSDGTAVAGDTYDATSGTLSFPPTTRYYQVMQFTVPIRNNDVIDGPVTVNLRLGNVSAGSALGEQSTAVLTIDDTPAPPAAYSFTVLYAGGAEVGLPSINDIGNFAFDVLPFSGGMTLYSGNLEAPSLLNVVATAPSPDFDFFSGLRFPVDNGQRVALRADLAGEGGNAIVLASNSSTPTTLLQAGVDAFSFGEPAMSGNGTIAVSAGVIVANKVDGILRGGLEGFATVVKERDLTDVGILSGFGSIVAVNNPGTVAFTGSTFTGGSGIFTTNGSAITTIASSATFASFRENVSINDSEQVAFIATDPTGTTSVVIGQGGSLSVVASNGSEYNGFGGSVEASPVIGNNGVVAFVAGRPNGVRGIYTGPSASASKVVEVGDSIDIGNGTGTFRTVTDLRLGAINGSGFISFLATVTDNGDPEVVDVAVVVAMPPPPPCDFECLPPPIGLRPARR
jgi:hypothetical protein